MNNNIKQHSYWIPKNYYAPAMFALDIYYKEHHFNQAVDIAHHFFTADPNADYYIPPAKLNRNTLAKHLHKYIINT